MDSAVPRQQPSIAVVSEPRLAASAEARFRAIFEAELAYLWTSLGRLGVPERDREDLANEVFFRVHRRLPDYDPSRPLRPWLFAFAVRVASEQRRLGRSRYETVGVEQDAAAFAISPARDRAEARQLVALGLSRLDLGQRAIFVLHYLDEFSIPEIARALEIPEGTAYSRLRVARQSFTTAIRDAQQGRP